MADRLNPALTRHIGEIWPEEQLDALLAAGDAVRDFLSHPGWLAVSAVLDCEVETIDRALDGHVLEQAQYAHLHGKRGAITAAEEAANAIVGMADRRREEQAKRHERAEPALQEA